MIFDLSNELESEQFKTRSDFLLKKKVRVELSEKKVLNPSDEEQRTLRQNRTVHMWFSVIADEIGYTNKNDCKRDVKRTILGMNPCVNKLTGEIGNEDYKTSEMSISELSYFMDKMKIWADQELGIYLPMWSDPGYNELINKYKNR